MKILTRFSHSLILVLIALSSFSQSNFYHQYEKGEYDKLESKLLNGLNSEPNNVVYNHVLGKVYATKSYVNFDLKKAYEYLSTANKYYDRLPTYDKERLARIPLTARIIENDFVAVCDTLLIIAMAKGTIPDLNEFINLYTKAPQSIKDKATNTRNALAYAEASKLNTLESYELFINTYPFAKEVYDAEIKRDKIAYDAVLKLNTVAGFQDYVRKYPKSKYSEEAEFTFMKMLFEEDTKDGTYDSYVKYIIANPKSELSKVAIEKMVAICENTQNIPLLKKTVLYSKNIHYEYALYHYYNKLTDDGEFVTLYDFGNQFNVIPFENTFRNDIKIAEFGENLELYRGYDSTKIGFYVKYIQLAAPKEKAYIALQRLIYPDVFDHNWKKALEKVETVQKYFGENDPRIVELKKMLQSPFDNSVKVTKLNELVNTKEGGEYSPIISADNSTLYFCGKRRKESYGGEDIFMSKFVDGDWAQPTIIDELSDPTTNDAALSISADGTTMIYFRGGTIYVSERLKNGWSQGFPISNEINEARWNADAMISSDGNALIFASIRPEGLNYYTDGSFNVGIYHATRLHQSDIYYCLKTADGWSKPKSLGNVINTKYTDRSPFLHPDMKTLYFSSDGHGGLGGMDVFMSKRLSDTCWDCWSTPVNVGKEINTPEDNWGYKISTDGNYAYYAAQTAGAPDHDIFYCTLPQKMRPQKVTTVTGKLVDSEGNPISATITWEDLKTGEIIGQSKSNPADGSYFIVLPQGKMYGYYIDDKNYYPQSSFIDLSGKTQAKEITNDISAVTFEQMRQGGSAVRLNNLFFDSGKSDLLPESIPELKRVAKILVANNASVEISGHTDNVGEVGANNDLSLRRAQAVKDFLIKQGVPTTLLVVIGHGEMKPIDSNETEKGKANNRRVEMRFIK